MHATRIAHRIVLATMATAVVTAPGLGAWAHSGHPHARLSEPAAAEAPAGRRAEFDFDIPGPGTYRLPVIKPAPDGAVLDARGAARRLHQPWPARSSS